MKLKTSAQKKMLIEGESILNDGFVVAVFATLSVIIFETEEISLTLSGVKLVVNILGALALGIVLGRLTRFAIYLFFMMYPIMVKIDFSEVIKAGKSGKPVFFNSIYQLGY